MTHVVDTNLQKELLSEYKWNSKNKSKEHTKFLADKKSLITILFRQCDEATQTKIALGANYKEECDNTRLLAFLEQMCSICFGGDDGGLSYGPYKQVVAIKSLNTYTNNEPHDPHGFKEQVKIKFEANKAIVGRFPNGTTALIYLLGATCVGTKIRRTKSINDLPDELKEQECQDGLPHIHSISKRQLGTYQPNIPTTNLLTNVEVTREIKVKEMIQNLKIRIPSRMVLPGHTLKILQQTKTLLLLAGGGASLGAHVSETSQATSCPSRTVETNVGAQPIDDKFWDNTNPADVSVDMVNKQEQMTGSHITKFYTHRDKQPAIADLLCQEDQKYDNQHYQQLTTCEHNTR